MKASDALSTSLQSVLVDLIELHLQAKQAHWNIVGTNFRDLHLQLDEITDAAREFSDEIAERMRALAAVPDGRSATVTRSTRLAALPAGEVSTTDAIGLITERLDATVDNIRAVHDVVDEADPSSADLLHVIIVKLEQYSWMVGAETQKPRKPAAKGAARKSA